MRMTEEQFNIIKAQLKKLVALPDGFYAKKFAGIDIDAIQTQEDFEKLPFTDKGDLREAYPLGLAAVPQEEIVRIHSSSGTTGTPVVIPYTKKDVEDWAIQFARCYEYAGITKDDIVQITPGYGLWTAGIGFQAGCERLGAMAIPMGPGNTEKQLKMMQDFGSTVLCATSSYALLLAEEIAKRGIGDSIKLRKGVIGSERWGEKMRRRIANELGVELYDIYGLTEIYGPGIGINCNQRLEDFPEDIRSIAGSVSMATGMPCDRGRLTAEIINAMDEMYADWLRGRWDVDRYRADCATIGREVRVIRGGRERNAFAEAVDDDFGLVVRYEDGTRETVFSGEVSVRGLEGYV